MTKTLIADAYAGPFVNREFRKLHDIKTKKAHRKKLKKLNVDFVNKQEEAKVHRDISSKDRYRSSSPKKVKVTFISPESR